MSNLFGAVKEQEVEKEQMFAEVREALGITADRFHINNVERLDWYLKKLLDLETEAEAAKIQYAKVQKSLESQRNSLEYLFGKEAETVIRQECDRINKQTLIRPFGTCRFRDMKPYWKKESEIEFQEWLEGLDEQRRKFFEVKPKALTCNLDAAKAFAEDMFTAEGKVDAVPGLTRDEGGLKLSISSPAKDKE